MESSIAYERQVLKEQFEAKVDKLFEDIPRTLPGIPRTTLGTVLENDGQQAVVGRKFVGFDEWGGRGMIYRIDKYSHDPKKPQIQISDLTSVRDVRTSTPLDIADHLNNPDVTDRNLRETAEYLGLSTEHFHRYV